LKEDYSMGLFDKIKKQNDNYDDFAGDSEYYGDSYDEAETMAEETAAPAPTPVEPAAFGATASLKIVNPKSYKDAAEIADFLMNGNTILLNIEGLAPDQAIRLLDYLAGATHAVGGLITKVGRSTIVVAPKNVDVSSIEAMVSTN
jgi:cell division inhibitor SepF